MPRFWSALSTLAGSASPWRAWRNEADNIGWDPNPAIYNNEGAVYFSIIQGGIVDAGGDVSAVWDFAPPHDMSKTYPSRKRRAKASDGTQSAASITPNGTGQHSR
jgi:hypothetical protein